MTDVTAAMITGKETVEFLALRPRAPPPRLRPPSRSRCAASAAPTSRRSAAGTSTAVGVRARVGRHGRRHRARRSRASARATGWSSPYRPRAARAPSARAGSASTAGRVSAVARGRDPLAPPHGGFAPSITVAAGAVLHADPGLTDEEAAQVEPATVAFHGVRRSRIAPGDTVVVQGAGPIGLFAMQFARAAGAGQVLIVEPSEMRRRIGLELGASSAVAPDEAADAVEAPTRGMGADVVFECAGVPSLLQTAADLTRSGGVVSLLSFLAQPATINAARWLAKELTVVASNAFTHDDFRRSMTFLADGRVRPLPCTPGRSPSTVWRRRCGSCPPGRRTTSRSWSTHERLPASSPVGKTWCGRAMPAHDSRSDTTPRAIPARAVRDPVGDCSAAVPMRTMPSSGHVPSSPLLAGFGEPA